MFYLVSCGGIDNIPEIFPGIVSLIVNIIKIVIPIILIIYGMLDLGKAVMAGEEKEIKGAQKLFIKRLIAAIIVFLIVAIVQLVFSMLAKAGGDTEGVSSCIDCFISNKCGK